MPHRLSGITCFLLDMDGTFYLGDQLLEGSLDFLKAIKDTGRQALFLTNNSSKDAVAYLEKLRRMGVPEEFCRVYTSGQAAGQYVLKNLPGKRAYLVGNDLLRRELDQMGVPLSDDQADYVLLAFDTTLTYEKLNRACRLIREGAPYIATHPDFNCPTEDGPIPDTGSMIALIEASTGRRPDIIIGKPNRGIVDGALAITGTTTAETAMVGDRLYTDIATGVLFGMTAILVLTGEATMEDVPAATHKPDLIFDRLSDMIPYLSK